MVKNLFKVAKGKRHTGETMSHRGPCYFRYVLTVCVSVLKCYVIFKENLHM